MNLLIFDGDPKWVEHSTVGILLVLCDASTSDHGNPSHQKSLLALVLVLVLVLG